MTLFEMQTNATILNIKMALDEGLKYTPLAMLQGLVLTVKKESVLSYSSIEHEMNISRAINKLKLELLDKEGFGAEYFI